MEFLGIDKLDDILYKPVEAICNWIEEPLKGKAAKRELAASQQAADLELRKTNEAHKNQMAANQQAADIEAAKRTLDQKLKNDERAAENAAEKERRAIDNAANKEAAEINAEIRRWNAEIDKMIMEEEDARRDKLVESIKRYQIDLANASRDIVDSILNMSLENREKANTMVLAKTRAYKALQDEAIDQTEIRLVEIGEKFSNNDRVRIMMEDRIINQMDSIVDMAGRFILELSEDIKRLNANTDEMIRVGMDNINAYLKPVSNTLGVNADFNHKQIQ